MSIATATHIVSEILPKLPVRQWVLSVPKWIRYYLVRGANASTQTSGESLERLSAVSTFGENADAMKLHYDVNKNSQERQAPLNLTARELLDKLVVITTMEFWRQIQNIDRG